MKLRIQDSTLRFRLTRKEVERLREQGGIDAEVCFAPDRALRYSVTSTSAVDTIEVDYANDHIRVQLPSSTVLSWCDSDKVSIKAAGRVEVLIEKDFQCLHRPDHLEPDAFPNLLAGETRAE